MKNRISYEGNFSYIALGVNNSGQETRAKVNAEAISHLLDLGRTWRLSSNGYAICNYNEKGIASTQMMHGFLSTVMKVNEFPSKKLVDHINGLKLDNTMDNLRYVSNAENLYNVGNRMVNITDKEIKFLLDYARKIGIYNFEDVMKHGGYIDSAGYFTIADARQMFYDKIQTDRRFLLVI